jgi:CheY-like chemotaxis protein
MTKVLLVDDDEIARSALAAELEESGFEVTIASNVPQALTLIAAEKYDVLIGDLHRPGAGEGLTAVSAMRHAVVECIPRDDYCNPSYPVASQ